MAAGADTTPGTLSRGRSNARGAACLLLAAAAALASSAPVAARQAPAGELAFRLGIAGGGGLCTPALAPGVELRSGGELHLLGALDVYLFRARRSEACQPRPAVGEVTEITRSSLSPPRLLAGVGWRPAGTGTTPELRAFVGQQGIVEGFHPLVGAGAALAGNRAALGVEASVHRAQVNARAPNPYIEGLFEETPLRRTWAPRWELFARLDAGAISGRGARTTLFGAAAGAAGGVAGGIAGAVASGCSGEGCAGPFILGAILGESLALPLGVHLAEGRRGSYAAAALTSLAIAAAGGAIILVVGDSGPAPQGVSVLVPIIQLAASRAMERRTAR